MSEVAEIYKTLNSGKPIDAEFLFPNLSFRRGKDGPIHRVSVEVKEELWTALKYLPANIRLRAVLQVVPDGEIVPDAAVASPEPTAPTPTRRRAKKEKPAKGGWGKFWQQLCAINFFSNLVLQEWLLQHRSEDDFSPEQTLRQVFGVSSRTFISPTALLAKLKSDLPEQAFASLKVTIERAHADAARAASGGE